MDLLAELRRRRVVAIVRGSSERLAEVVSALVASGLALVELPLTTPGALGALRDCAGIPGVLLGAGTVLTAAEATAAVDAGAGYLVTPAVIAEVLAEASLLGVPVLSGAFTASEVLACMRAGATAAKIFPASLGGPEYVAALRQPLPDVPMVAVGGVTIDAAASYLEAGAIAVGLGTPLIGDACSTGSLEALTERAAALLELIGSA